MAAVGSPPCDRQPYGRFGAGLSARRPPLTYALLLGHLQGVRGPALFDTLWAQLLDQPTSHLFDLAATASQYGMLELRHAGGVVEVTFHELLRPFDRAQEKLL